MENITENPIKNNQPQIPVSEITLPTKNQFSDNKQKLLALFKEILKHLTSNKKVLYLLGGILGLLLLVILAGLIFGNKTKKPVATPRITPTPINENIGGIPATPSGILGENEQKLKTIKDDISNFDPNQSKLTPPTLDFKVDF